MRTPGAQSSRPRTERRRCGRGLVDWAGLAEEDQAVGLGTWPWARRAGLGRGWKVWSAVWGRGWGCSRRALGPGSRVAGRRTGAGALRSLTSRLRCPGLAWETGPAGASLESGVFLKDPDVAVWAGDWTELCRVGVTDLELHLGQVGSIRILRPFWARRAQS